MNKTKAFYNKNMMQIYCCSMPYNGTMNKEIGMCCMESYLFG